MNTLPTPRKINVAALVVVAGGLLILFVSVPDRFPTVPPGPIILLAAAGLVASHPGAGRRSSGSSCRWPSSSAAS